MPWSDPNASDEPPEKSVRKAKLFPDLELSDEPSSTVLDRRDEPGLPLPDDEMTEEEERFNELMDMDMKQLRVIADDIGATRRKSKEDAVDEILDIEFGEEEEAGDDSGDEPDNTGEGGGSPGDIIDLSDDGRTWAYRIRGKSPYKCSDCNQMVRGTDKLLNLENGRIGMPAICDCDGKEWRWILSHTLQVKTNGNWKQHA